MNRCFSACGLALALVGSGFASDPIRGVMTLTHGFVTRPDGTRVSVVGAQIPFVAERVAASPFRPLALGANGSAPSNVTIYSNDNGEQTYFYTPEMPSSLDDAKLSPVGNGAPWRFLTNGVHTSAPQTFLIRWQVFNRFVQGRGAGRSAFDVVLGDFGGVVRAITEPGAFKVTYDISVIGLRVPDGQAYLGTQYREPQLNGQGAFLPAFSSVFSGGGVRQGTSEDIFFWDFDPEPNGLYEETEADNYGGPPNEANHLLTITTTGTQNTVLPQTMTVPFGRLVSGDAGSLWFVDNDIVTIQQVLPFSANTPDAAMQIEAPAPPGSPLALSLILVSSVSQPNIRQTIELFNFVQQRWVVVDERIASTTMQRVEGIVTSNPSEYVQGSPRRVRARVLWKPTAAQLSVPFFARADLANWSIVVP
jgi:hypothetical protein